MSVNPLLLLPDFAVIFLGAVLVRGMALGPQFWSGAERLVYYVLLPPMLFSAIARAQFALDEAIFFVGLGLAVMGLAVVASALAYPLLRPNARTFASCMQTGFRFNSYVGLALASSLWGPKAVALMAVLIAVCLPIANVIAVLALARQHELHVARELIRNPLVLATLAGLLANLLGLRMPEAANVFLTRLGNASLAMGLLCIGAGLKFPIQTAAMKTLSYFTALKLLGVPLIAWAVAWIAQPQPLEAAVLILFSALPTASSAYVLATRLGGDGASVAAIISAQTVFAMLSLPLVMMLAPI